MRSRLLTLTTTTALVTASAALVAAPAHAATGVSASGSTLTVTLGSPTSFLIEPTSGGYRIASDEGFGTVNGCTMVDWDWVCAGITHVNITGTSGDDSIDIYGSLQATVNAGAGNDSIYAVDGTALTANGEGGDDTIQAGDGPTVVDGGDGNDVIHGGPSTDTINGGAGNDRVSGGTGSDTVLGGPGNDEVSGDHASAVPQPDDGNDVVDGGDGDDLLFGMGGADVLRGGPGNDTVTYEGQYSGSTNVTFAASLDGVANDGVTGEGDNIGADGGVENMKLPSYVDHMTVIGNDGPNYIEALPNLSLVVDARGGDDVLLVGATSTGSKSTVNGGAGNDSINNYGETSSVDGGPGNDTISSGKGNDTVTGGPGSDTIDAGYGNDVIDTADGEVDQVSCGIGGDSLKADATDVVNADPLALCESITRVNSAPPVVTQGQITVNIGSKVRVSRKGIATFKVANGMSGAVRIKALAKAKRLKLGTGTLKLAAGTAGKLKLTLTRKARAHLRRHHSVKAVVTFRVVEGGTGTYRKKVRLLMK